ncbi:MAG TPA: hypothetical protein VFY71_17580 [Planctomycetota bacterium]|nr:hypothetical protein [Planctomycetota bacterium]
MRRIVLLAPLLLVSCSALFGGDDKPKTPPQDVTTMIVSAVDEAQAKSDAQLTELRTQLADLAHTVDQLKDDLGAARTRSNDDNIAAIAAEQAAAQSQRQLLLTGAAATLALLATLVLAVVVIWQALLLRRAQRSLAEADARATQAVERAAMASGRPATPGAPAAAPPVTPPLASPSSATAAAAARLRQRPVS